MSWSACEGYDKPICYYTFEFWESANRIDIIFVTLSLFLVLVSKFAKLVLKCCCCWTGIWKVNVENLSVENFKLLKF